MAVEYRKAGLRTFFRIENGIETVRVINKHFQSEVTISKSPVIACDAEDFNTTGITESEFREQFNLAMSRIENFKV